MSTTGWVTPTPQQAQAAANAAGALRYSDSMTWGDYGRFAAQGALGLVEGVGALGEWATGAGGLRRWAGEASERVGEGLSPRGQRVANAALIPSWSQEEGQPLPESAWEVGLPGYLASRLAQNVPSIVAGGVGGVAARSALGLGARIAGTTVGPAAGARAFTTGVVGTSAGLGAGDALSTLRDVVRQQAQRELGQNADAAAIERRTDELMESTNRWMPALAGGAAGAVSGYGLSRVLGGRGLWADRGMLPRAAGGALVEGGTEAFEEGAANAAAQAGAFPVTQRPVNWYQAAAAGAEGAVVGGTLGGALSVARPGMRPEDQSALTGTQPPGGTQQPGNGNQSPPGGGLSALNGGAQPPAFVPPGTQQPPAFVPPNVPPPPQPSGQPAPAAPAFVPPGVTSTPPQGPAPAFVPPGAQTGPQTAAYGYTPPAPAAQTGTARTSATAAPATPPPAAGAPPAAATTSAAGAPPASSVQPVQNTTAIPGLIELVKGATGRGELAYRSPAAEIAQVLNVSLDEAKQLRKAMNAMKPGDFPTFTPPPAPAPAVSQPAAPAVGLQTASPGPAPSAAPAAAPAAPKLPKAPKAPKPAAAAPASTPAEGGGTTVVQPVSPSPAPQPSPREQRRATAKPRWEARRQARAQRSAEVQGALQRLRGRREQRRAAEVDAALTRFKARRKERAKAKGKKVLAFLEPEASKEGVGEAGKRVLSVAQKRRELAKARLAPKGERRKGTVATVELDDKPPVDVDPDALKAEREAQDKAEAAARRDAEHKREAREVRGEEASRSGARPAFEVTSNIQETDEDAARATLAETGVAAADTDKDTAVRGEQGQDAATRQDIVAETAADEQRSEGVQNYEAMGAAKKEDRAPTTAKARYGEDILRKVLDGEMSVADAVRAYGRKAPGSSGVGWTFDGTPIPTFAAFVEAKLARIPTGDAALALITRMSKPGAKLAYANQLTDVAARQEIEGVLAQARDIAPESIPIRGPQVREAPKRDKTPTVVAPPVRRIVVPEDQRAGPKMTDAEREAFLQLKAKRGKNASPEMPDDLDGYDEGKHQSFFKPGERMTLAEAFRRYINSSAPRSLRMAFTRLLANRLIAAASDTNVVFVDAAFMRAVGKTARGYFNPTTDTIYIRADYPLSDLNITLLHEGVHAATYWKVRTDPALRAKMDKLFEDVKTAVGESDNRNVRYAFKNVDEFMAMAMTDPVFQAYLSAVKVTRSLAAQYGVPQNGGLWRRFVNLVADAIGFFRSGRSLTVLDMVVRSTGEVIDARANDMDAARAAGVFDVPELPAGLATRVSAVQDALDTGRFGDKSWAAMLGFRRLDQLVRDYGGFFKNGALKAFADAETRITRAIDDFKDRHATTVEGGIGFMLTTEGQEKLAPLMVRATAAQMHPDMAFDSKAHDHIEKNESNRAIHRVLQQQFNELSTEAKDHYRKARDYFQDTRREEVEAMLDRVLRTLAPNAQPADMARLRSLIGTAQALKNIEAMDDAAVKALGFSEEALVSRPVLRHLAQIYALREVPGPYFPLNRFGDYVVSYKQDDWTSDPMTRDAAAQFVVAHGGTGLRVEQRNGGYVVTGTLRGTEFFESKAKAEERRAELRRRGYEPSEVESKRQMFALPELDAFGLSILERAIRTGGSKRGLSGTQTDAMVQALRGFAMQYMPAGRTRMGSELQREGVAGASQDMARVLGEHYNKAAARYGFLKEGAARDEALEAMRREIDDRTGKPAGRQIKQQALLNELEMRTQHVEESGIENLARKATKFGFFWALLSPSLPIVNTFQAAANAHAVLGARYGFGKAAKAIAAAQRAVGLRVVKPGAKTMLVDSWQRRLERHDFNLFAATADHLVAQSNDKAGTQALMDALKARNLVDHTMQLDLYDLGGGDTATSKARRALDRLQSATMMLPQIADVNNRVVVAKAAYDLARRAGKDQNTAVDEAIDQLMRSEPVYNASNKARIFTNRGAFGKWAAPLTQFNQGAQHLYDLIVTSGRDAFRSDDPAVRKEARRILTGLVVNHSIFSGLLGVLAFKPLALAIQAVGLAVSDRDEPWDYESGIRRYLATTVGPEVAEIVARGLPRALGFDLSQRMSLDAINLPEIRSYDAQGFSRAIGEFMLAPSGSRASQVLDGFGHLFNGRFLDAARDISPRMLSDGFKAAQFAVGERTDQRGRTEATVDVGAAGVLLQAFGFRPSEQAERTEQRGAIQYAQRRAVASRQRIVDAYVGADPADRAAMRERITAHNEQFPAHRITSDSLARAIAERRRQQRESRGSGGAYVPNAPAQARWQRDMGSFANVP